MSLFSSIVLSPGLLLDSIITYPGHDTALEKYISISVVHDMQKLYIHCCRQSLRSLYTHIRNTDVTVASMMYTSTL